MFGPISSVNFYRFTIFTLLLILIHYETILAYNIDRQAFILNDDESNLFSDDILPSSDIWPETDHHQNYPGFDLRRGIIHIIPYKKRTIPLELQKALYAHGIVGRRR